MALSFDGTTGGGLVLKQMYQGTPDDVNITFTNTTSPTGVGKWELSFKKANETVEVFTSIDWATAGENVRMVEFELPEEFNIPPDEENETGHEFYPIVTLDGNPYTVTEDIPPYSQFTDAVMIDGSNSATTCPAWVRYHNNKIKFRVEPATGVDLKKLQARFRYNKVTKLVSF